MTRLSLGLLAAAAHAAAAPFSASNLVALRLGSGSSAVDSTSQAIFLDEINPSSGAIVQSVAMDSTVSLPGSENVPCLSSYQNGSPNTVGLLSRSVDGLFVSFAALNYAPGTTWR